MVTGATGFLGKAVAARMASRFSIARAGNRNGGEGVVRTDLRDRDAVGRLIDRERPAAVVHCAAYREPDFCEEHPDEARRLNVDAVRFLCEALSPSARLVLISTDYVFDGEQPPYREESPRGPLSVYGQSKAEAEDIVLSRHGSLVIRVPVLVGAGATLESSGFIGEMIRAVREQKPAGLDDYHVRFPTWTVDVAEAIAFLLEREAEGCFHVSGPDGGTRYALTLDVARILGMGAGHLSPSRAPVRRRAVRPRDAHLAADKIRSLGFKHLTAFPEVIRAVMGSFGDQRPAISR